KVVSTAPSIPAAIMRRLVTLTDIYISGRPETVRSDGRPMRFRPSSKHKRLSGISMVNGRLEVAAAPLYNVLSSSRGTACFDYLESISLVEREDYLDAHARICALGFVFSPATSQEIQQLWNSNPAW